MKSLDKLETKHKCDTQMDDVSSLPQGVYRGNSCRCIQCIVLISDHSYNI